jgi:hypothetical protein
MNTKIRERDENSDNEGVAKSRKEAGNRCFAEDRIIVCFVTGNRDYLV